MIHINNLFLETHEFWFYVVHLSNIKIGYWAVKRLKSTAVHTSVLDFEFHRRLGHYFRSVLRKIVVFLEKVCTMTSARRGRELKLLSRNILNIQKY